MERDSHDETSSGKGHATHRSAYLNHKYNGKGKNISFMHILWVLFLNIRKKFQIYLANKWKDE